jgi:hypothetical protein
MSSLREDLSSIRYKKCVKLDLAAAAAAAAERELDAWRLDLDAMRDTTRS